MRHHFFLKYMSFVKSLVIAAGLQDEPVWEGHQSLCVPLFPRKSNDYNSFPAKWFSHTFLCFVVSYVWPLISPFRVLMALLKDTSSEDVGESIIHSLSAAAVFSVKVYSWCQCETSAQCSTAAVQHAHSHTHSWACVGSSLLLRMLNWDMWSTAY